MTWNEFLSGYAILQSEYPDTFRGMSQDLIQAKARLWFDSFKCEDGDLFAAVIRKHISTSTDRFMPNIGIISEELRQAKDQQEQVFEQEWETVQIAMRNSTYNSREEFDGLSPTMKRALGSASRLHELALMDNSALQYARHDLEQAYVAERQREHTAAKTPQNVRDLLEPPAPAAALDTPKVQDDSPQPIEAPCASAASAREFAARCKDAIVENMAPKGRKESGLVTPEQKTAAMARLREYEMQGAE